VEENGGPVRACDLVRVSAGGREPRGDALAVEEPLEIRVGTETVSVTMRTPGNDFELAAGYLATEGLLETPSDIVRLEHCRDVRSPEEEGNVVMVRAAVPAARLAEARRLTPTSSSCGICGKASIDAVRTRYAPLPGGEGWDPQLIASLPQRLESAQRAFAATGGLHAAGVFWRDGTLAVAREDIGRHNAVDKVLGRLFLDGAWPLSAAALAVSGRASFEIVQKALAAGVPVLAAVSAPSSLAVELARAAGMLLAGFVRGGAFNLYAGEERLSPGGAARASSEGSSR
jgi:FdhD protein